MKIKKGLTSILIITFLCQNVAFGTPERISTLRPALKTDNLLEETIKLLNSQNTTKDETGNGAGQPLASNDDNGEQNPDRFGCKKMFDKLTKNTKFQKLISKIHEEGYSIGFVEDISDFSKEINGTICFNSGLFNNKLVSSLSLRKRNILKIIILSQLKRYLWSKPHYDSKIERLVCEMSGSVAEIHTLIKTAISDFDKEFLKQILAKRRIKTIRKFLRSLKIDSDLMIKKLDLADRIIDMAVLRGGMEEDFHLEPLGYGDHGLSELGIKAVVAFYEDIFDLEFLLPILGYWITQNEENGLRIYSETMDRYYAPGWDYTSLNKRFVQLTSMINEGRGSPSYNKALEYLKLRSSYTGPNSSYFTNKMIKVLGFLLELEKHDSAIEDFLWDYLQAQEEIVIDTAFIFCQQLIQEAIKEDADIFFLYRGAWPFKEITAKIAEYKRLDIGDKLHELYFTGKTKMQDNASPKEQIKYLYDKNVFTSKKVILVDGGFKASVARHIVDLMSSKEVIAATNDAFSINITPLSSKKEAAIRLLVFAQSPLNTLDYDIDDPRWFKAEQYPQYNVYNFSPVAAAYGERGPKFKSLEKLSIKSTDCVFLFDERLEHDYHSPMRLLIEKGKIYLPLEKTYLSRLRDISKTWLNKLMDKNLFASNETINLNNPLKYPDFLLGKPHKSQSRWL